MSQVAEDGVHRHGASIVIGVLQTGEGVLPSSSCHHLDSGDEKHDQEGASILLEA